MSEYEILRSYHNAVARKKQVGILAQLNGCDRSEIVEILVGNGIPREDLVRKPRQRRTKKEEDMDMAATTKKGTIKGGNNDTQNGSETKETWDLSSVIKEIERMYAEKQRSIQKMEEVTKKLEVAENALVDVKNMLESR